jgi:hypothetical protein
LIITPVDPCPRLASARPARLWYDPLYGWCAQVGAVRLGFFSSRDRLVAYLGQARRGTAPALRRNDQVELAIESCG